MSILIEPQYFPPSIYFTRLGASKHVKINPYDRYQKSGFFSRCIVCGANGPIQLSIPLARGRDQRGRIGDIEIDYRQPWQRRHLKTLESAYNGSPWFAFYRDELRDLFRHQPPRLIDWNLSCLRWVCDKLSLEVSFELLNGEMVADGSEAGFRPTPANISTLDPHPVPYPQVFADRFGFIPYLSILDRLFCIGAG